MIRLITFFAGIIAISLGLSWIVASDGAVTIDWLGYHIESSLAFALALVITVTLFIFLCIWSILWLKNTPYRLVNSYRERKKRVATQALIEGFSAVALGDAARAKKLAARADQALPVTIVLQAQTAFALEDAEATSKYLTAMLQHKETELLGIKGLLQQAQQEKKWEEALALALKAHMLKPESKWVNLALLSLYKQAGRWQEAQDAAENARQHHALTKEEFTHESGILSYIRAKEDAEKECLEEAVSLARTSHQLLPAFAPAALLYAELLFKQGKKKAAVTVLENGWRYTPAPDLAALLLTIYEDEPAEKKVKRLSALALLNPNHPESHSAVASFLINLRALDKAREHLRIALSKGETVTLCKLMAKLELKNQMDPEQAEAWLERALVAPLGTVYLCNHCGSHAAKWEAHCQTCQTFDSLRTPSPQRIAAPSAQDRDLLAYAASGNPV